MSEKTYCPICGKRIVPHSEPQSLTSGPFTFTATFYFSDSTEDICFGHAREWSAIPIGGLSDTGYATVPKAFYDALSDEDVQL